METATIGEIRALLVNSPLRIAPLTDAEIEARKEAARRDASFEATPIGAQREAAATWLELANVLRKDLVLETGPMNKPLAALRKYSWDTVKLWGLDVEQQKSLIRKPRPKSEPWRWFDSSDYPEKMIRGGYQAIVNFRMMVDASGKPTSCHIQQSTRPKEFDDIVCRAAMRRASFEPALDSEGKPVPSYWRQTVRFMLAQ
jgi:TonB family protein